MNAKVKEVLNGILDMFKKVMCQMQSHTQLILMADIPSAKWSFTNRTDHVLLQGHLMPGDFGNGRRQTVM